MFHYVQHHGVMNNEQGVMDCFVSMLNTQSSLLTRPEGV